MSNVIKRRSSGADGDSGCKFRKSCLAFGGPRLRGISIYICIHAFGLLVGITDHSDSINRKVNQFGNDDSCIYLSHTIVHVLDSFAPTLIILQIVKIATFKDFVFWAIFYAVRATNCIDLLTPKYNKTTLYNVETLHEHDLSSENVA